MALINSAGKDHQTRSKKVGKKIDQIRFTVFRAKKALCFMLSWSSLLVSTLVVSFFVLFMGARSSVDMSGESTSLSKYPVQGPESLMSAKQHGTSDTPIQSTLRWNSDRKVADKIGLHNRHYAEYSGYWQKTNFLKEVSEDSGEITFYDSATGAPLFIAPRGRTFDQFKKESIAHGWPSFRDEEVVWENVRCLKDGECVSTTGTHLGHNLPDRSGNRYCINIVSVAGEKI